ncbi:MAG TPA: T9SS type A sorting domain-containing protein [Bacteroidia bacterium]|jgi:hypothetical protein|nr:T9SS type A sorting domain-containing protein [Bacteroidia bacterium]
MKPILHFSLKLIILIILTMFLHITASAQVATFQKYMGGPGEDYVYDMHKTSDGGYLFGALTTSYPGPWVRSWIIKTDVNGDTLWTSVYSDTTNGGKCDQQYINDIAPVTDGGAFAGGGKSVCGDTNEGGNVARVDAHGNVKWVKYFPIDCDPYPVIQCKDGNFMAGGYITLIGGYLSPKNGFLTKLDSATGDTIWSRSYGHGAGPGTEWFYHIVQTVDGGYLAAGYTTSFGQGGQDIYLVKTDANGALMWSKTYGTPGNELAFGHCLQPTSDGGYILTGPGGVGKKNIFLLKIDASGNVLWSKVYDGGFSHGVRQTPDGGYIIAGQSLVGNNIALIRTDAGGSVVWSEYYGSVGGAPNAVELAGDGGYIAAGQVDIGPFGKKDLYFIKTDSTGNSGCNQTSAGVTDSNFTFTVTNPATIVGKGSWTASYTYAFTRGGQINNSCSTVGVIENKNAQEAINIYPNPVQNTATLLFESQSQRYIQIFDITGRKIIDFESTDKEYIFSCTDLSTGMYFIKVVSGKNTQVVKFIKG